jgi:D-alanine-D-alanine ligase
MFREHILVLHNKPVLPADHPEAEAEHEVVQVARLMGGHLRRAGFRVTRLALDHDPGRLLSCLRRRRPDAVFNLFEGTAHNSALETSVAGLLQMLEVPFTGSPASALELARSKHLTKLLFRGAGLPTADFLVVHQLPTPPCSLAWPVIVKPATLDASVGVSQQSVVCNRVELEARVEYVLRTYGPPVMIERFIPGREVNVALLEAPDLQSLPPSEILFDQMPPGSWPILTYDGKWAPGTPAFEDTPPRCPADLPAELVKRLNELAERAYRLLGCRDYARVDFRIDPEGTPFILEVNPNPGIAPDEAGYHRCLRAAGISPADFAVRLVRNALDRRAISAGYSRSYP